MGVFQHKDALHLNYPGGDHVSKCCYWGLAPQHAHSCGQLGQGPTASAPTSGALVHPFLLCCPWASGCNSHPLPGGEQVLSGYSAPMFPSPSRPPVGASGAPPLTVQRASQGPSLFPISPTVSADHRHRSG